MTKSATDGEAAEGRREMEGAGAVAHERSRPLRNASMFDRDEMEDMTATCSKPSPTPAAADSTGGVYPLPEFKRSSSSSRIRAVGVVGPRSEDESSFIVSLASILFLYIHLLESPHFSRHIRVPTVSNIVHRIPSPTDSHDCACVRSSTWTRIHPPTSSFYISPFMLQLPPFVTHFSVHPI